MCEAYFADWEKIRAAERAFEKIGQIAKDLGQTTLDEIGKTLPWRNIKGIHDIIAHEYAQINHRLLWEVIHDGDLDALLDAVTVYARKKGY